MSGLLDFDDVVVTFGASAGMMSRLRGRTTSFNAVDHVNLSVARGEILGIVGESGSGKTTACALVSDRIGVPHHEIDALFHGPGWQPRPQFHDDVARFVATEAWVTEWQYSEVRGLLAEREDVHIVVDEDRDVERRPR